MNSHVGNPFADHDLVASYEGWYETTGRRADELEKQLLDGLLADLPTIDTVLEVGCGTGHFSRWFEARGLHVVGADLSMEMLVESRHLSGLPFVRARAERLPFASRSVDMVAFITTLEFVADVGRTLSEACRVARKGILVGALNRRSVLGRRLRNRTELPWTSARLYNLGELKSLVKHAAAEYEPRISWRTTLWPGWRKSLALPWGGFIGISVTWG